MIIDVDGEILMLGVRLILGVFDGVSVLLTVYETLGVGVGDMEIEGVGDLVFTHSEHNSWLKEGVTLIGGVADTDGATTLLIKSSSLLAKEPAAFIISSMRIGSFFSTLVRPPITSIILSNSLFSGAGYTGGGAIGGGTTAGKYSLPPPRCSKTSLKLLKSAGAKLDSVAGSMSRPLPGEGTGEGVHSATTFQ